MLKAYIAAPFMARTPDLIRGNVNWAVDWAAQVNIAGKGEIFAVCPHSMTYPIWQRMDSLGYETLANDNFWYEGAIALLKSCDMLVLCPGWESSVGCRKEHDVAYQTMPIIDLDLMITFSTGSSWLVAKKADALLEKLKRV